MKVILLIFSILMSCDMASPSNEGASADAEIEEIQGLENSDSLELTGSKWIYTPYSDYSDCVDTLAFTTDSSGYEYRCEFEWSNDFTYEFRNDTLVLTEYGFVSEVDASLGKEIKGRSKFLKNKDEMILIGLAAGESKPFKMVEDWEFSYKLIENYR